MPSAPKSRKRGQKTEGSRTNILPYDRSRASGKKIPAALFIKPACLIKIIPFHG